MGILEDGKDRNLIPRHFSKKAARAAAFDNENPDMKRMGLGLGPDKDHLRPARDHSTSVGYFQKQDPQPVYGDYPADDRRQRDEGFNPLIFQAGKGNLSEVVRLLQSGKYDINDARYKNGYTALHAAAENGHTAVVETLLSYGADKTALNMGHHTAYALAKDRGHTDAIAAFSRHEAGLELIAAAEKGDRKKFGELMSQYAFTDRRLLETAKERAARNEYGDIAGALTDRIAALPKPAARKPSQLASSPPEPKKGGSMMMAILGALGIGGVASLLTGGLGLIPIALAAVAGMAIFSVTGSMRKSSPATQTASLPSSTPGKTAQAAADQHYMPTPEFEVPVVPNAKLGNPQAKLPGKNASPHL